MGPHSRLRLYALLVGIAVSFAACERVAQDQFARGAMLNWTPVRTDTSGKPLVGLAGYKIFYGTSASAMNTVVVLSDARATSHLVTNLAPGTWYFAVAAYTSSGTEGRRSNVVQKAIH
jgi:hypothetical protein